MMLDSSSLQLLQLRSGHRVGYELCGQGPRKLLYFHGFPGSSRQARLLAPICEEGGFQVLSFDRPGLGHSDPNPSRTGLREFPALTREIIEAFGWRRFTVLGISGGAPYALACAAAMPGQVLSAHLVCALGPLADSEFRKNFPRERRWGLTAMRWAPEPWVAGWAKSRIRRLERRRSAGDTFFPGLPDVDRETLGRAEVFSVLRASLQDAFRAGAYGVRADLANYLAPWPIAWDAIRCPTVFWHGTQDTLVPAEFSRILAARVRGARLRLIAGEGHFSLAVNQAREMMAEISRLWDQ